MKPWMIVAILGAAAIVYALMLPKRQVDKSSLDKDKMVQEVEATLEQYMAEIERENEELVGLIAQMKQETASRQLAQQEQLSEMRQRLVLLEQQNLQYETRLTAAEQGSQQAASVMLAQAQEAAAVQQIASKQPPQPLEPDAVSNTQPKEPSIRERYPDLFEFHTQGKSVDGIAKLVGMQRGEVQLILQLAKQEESL
ncbi:DUF3450 domain-containing protein [Paenibacillus sp. KQZ6P-2]|uniref:DUF3450 domain-containing protein n=1 Tax=Paenibacillus mangrovi TaxID=2931978 RepID=A0A9X1WLC4_9BACL|nr:DUF3450 domain-containing protein [Paenibacillus mangrovi]MCJ8010631.1 DUF3450 domain-containing protein [Paenibacillus mangrovi]